MNTKICKNPGIYISKCLYNDCILSETIIESRYIFYPIKHRFKFYAKQT